MDSASTAIAEDYVYLNVIKIPQDYGENAKIERQTILFDPVFSGNASPVSNSNRLFIGTDIYSADDERCMNH